MKSKKKEKDLNGVFLYFLWFSFIENLVNAFEE